MTEEILEFIEDNGPGVSFCQLETIPGFVDTSEKGRSIRVPENETICIWNQVSAKAVDALIALMEANKITVRPASILIYLVDNGRIPNLKLAKKLKHHYKDIRWLPVVLNTVVRMDGLSLLLNNVPTYSSAS